MTHDNEKEAPKSSRSGPIFSASDIAERWARLKAEGKVPPLSAVLAIVRKSARATNRED